MLKDFTPRLYQQTILGTAASFNTLVVLPTGMGKTPLAFMLSVQRLHQYPNSKILMLAPTKPLCEQHVQTFRRHLEVPEEKIVLFTGEIPPERRAELWKEATIVISTPQGLENDTINQRIRLEEASLLILDECQHATGEYSYVWLAQQYERLAKYPRILALTASPGSDTEKIREICKNLFIERVEVRMEKDPDVRPYIQQVRFSWVSVPFPEEFKKIRTILKDCVKSKLLEAQRYGFCSSDSLTKGELLQLQGELQKQISSGQRNFEILRSISLIAEALKAEHALELLETQGIMQLYTYMSKIREEAQSSKVKAVKNLVQDANFKAALHLTEELQMKRVNHPKLLKLRELLQEELQKKSDAKIIVFANYRSSADLVVKMLSGMGISNSVFVGQAKKEGMGFSQKQQKEILDKFRAGEFSILVATSVAEEGLDIPAVDKVIFYEPIPSAIRSIQRRGRTGRLAKGEVTLLITAGTRDEAHRWSAHHKEKRMYRNLEQLRKGFRLELPSPSAPGALSSHPGEPKSGSLQQFIPKSDAPPPIAILADHREKDNRVVKELIEMGLSVRTGHLEAADYIVSGRVAVELKKVPDFVASIIDGRLLEQVRQVKKNFEKAVFVIEGEEDIYAVRKVHANAIRGMLAALVLDFNVPVLYTKNPRDTAGLLAVMARREQDRSRDFSYHERKPHSLQEQQEFLVSSLPGIGVLSARNLLNYFGSVKAIVNASREELQAVEGVGEKTSERLWGLFGEGYGKRS